MCTVTIIPLFERSSSVVRVGYRLVTNRDEARTRPPAHPPARRELGAQRALWPIDALAGGTWVAVSDLGLTLTLLNLKGDPPAPLPPRDQLLSRGLVIPSIIDARSAAAAAARVADLEYERMAPFRLVAVDGRSVVVVRWTRRDDLSVETSPLETHCFASSGLGDHVVQSRLPLFARWFASRDDMTRERQDAFHDHQWPDRTEQSVRMSRPDARTVSTTAVSVTLTGDEPRAEMRYTADDVRTLMTLELRGDRAPAVNTGMARVRS